MRTAPARQRLVGARQKGVVLFIALIALVAMTLAAIALVRSMDTGLVIAGNTAFKLATTAAADTATESATTWLASNNAAAVLNASAATGYYANSKSGCDITGNRTPTDQTDDVGWDNMSSHPGCQAISMAATGMPAGFTGSYIITRMCAYDGSPFGQSMVNGVNMDNSCVGVPPGANFNDTPDYVQRGLTSAERSRIAAGKSPYYRIVARVVGPRNTTSFVETVVTLD